jgi:hypothetical protein
MKINQLIIRLMEIEKRYPDIEVKLNCSEIDKAQDGEYDFWVTETYLPGDKVEVILTKKGDYEC